MSGKAVAIVRSRLKPTVSTLARLLAMTSVRSPSANMPDAAVYNPLIMAFSPYNGGEDPISISAGRAPHFRAKTRESRPPSWTARRNASRLPLCPLHPLHGEEGVFHHVDRLENLAGPYRHTRFGVVGQVRRYAGRLGQELGKAVPERRGAGG